MTRAVLRGYDLGGDDQTHAVRLLGSLFYGYVGLEQGGGFSHSEPGLAGVLGPDPGRPRQPAAAAGPSSGTRRR